MAGFVTRSHLSGTTGRQFKIVARPDFGEILPQMHPRNHWFSSKHCAHARFVGGTHAGSTCTVRLRISFNCN